MQQRRGIPHIPASPASTAQTERDERARNTEAYYQRIRSKLCPDDTHYSEVFKRWEFIPDLRLNVDFHGAECQVCGNRFLRHLYKIKIMEQYKQTLPDGWPQSFWVGSICVQIFCHKDQLNKPLGLTRRAAFVNSIKKKKKKEQFVESLDKRLKTILQQERTKDLPRLTGILKTMNRRREINRPFTFQTVTDAIVVTVVLNFRSLKELIRYGLKIASPKSIKFSALDTLQGEELQFYLKSSRSYDDRSYKVEDIDEGGSDVEQEEESSHTVQLNGQ